MKKTTSPHETSTLRYVRDYRTGNEHCSVMRNNYSKDGEYRSVEPNSAFSTFLAVFKLLMEMSIKV